MESTSVVIHVRFAPNGTVVEISERPPAVAPQDWFDWLSNNAADVYQALAGGRGFFRLSREKLETLKSGIAAHKAA
jgi:hypothetical protein